MMTLAMSLVLRIRYVVSPPIVYPFGARVANMIANRLVNVSHLPREMRFDSHRSD